MLTTALSSVVPLLPRIAAATTFTVNTLNDNSGPGQTSLRDAIAASNGAGGSNTINFTGLSGSINLGSDLPAITTSVTVNFGTGVSLTGIGGVVQAGAGTTVPNGSTLGFTPGGIYTGQTNLQSGTFRPGANGYSATESSLTMAAGSTLDLASAGGIGGNGILFGGVFKSLSGNGSILLGNGDLNLTLNNNASGSFGGTLSGAGGLLLFGGGGALTLTGQNNTYSGPTNISAVLSFGVGQSNSVATLAAGAPNVFSPNSAVLVFGPGATLALNGFDQTIGSLAGVVAAGETANGLVSLGAGTLTMGGDNTSTSFVGTISGTGGLIKTGTGTFTLLQTAGAIYTGPTQVAGGVFQAGSANAFAPASAFTVNAGTTLDLASFDQTIGSLAGAGSVTLGAATLTTGNDGTSTTFSGVISGSGALSKQGAGTFTLAGANTYTGATAVNSGRLQTGIANALSTSTAVTVASGAIFDLNSFAQSIGSLAGAGNVTLGAAMLTTGNDGTSAAFSGAIAGPGGLTKTGAGTFSLTGTSTYGGPTNINAGVLSVDGSLLSTVNVNNGGTLMGNGTIGGLHAFAGGTVAPGHSIGLINVAGNATFAPGSIYQVEINAAGQGDRIAATGTATLTGGTVQALAAPGNYGLVTRYTILTATGGVTGTFANVTSNMAFLTPTLTYDANDAFLTLTRNASFFSTVALTFNQRAVAGALDASPFGSALVQAVLPLSAPQSRQAFDALSGEIHASAQSVMLDDSRYLRQAVLGRLRQASYAGEAGAFAALGTGGSIVAYSESDLVSSEFSLAYAKQEKRPVFPLKAPPRAPVQDPDLTVWAQAVGAWGKIDGDGNAADASRDLGGFFTGLDRRFGAWRAGIAGGYTNSRASVSARASSANIDSVHLAGYAGTSFGAWNFRSGAGFTWNALDTSRTIAFPGFVDQASARYHAYTGQVFGEVGYGMSLGRIAAEPFAALAFVHLDGGSFAEAGGVAALAGSGNREDVGYSTLGARAATNYPLMNAMVLTPRALLAWQHAFGQVTPTAALAFQSTGIGFTVAGVPIARDAALLDAGLDLRVTPRATVGLAYSGQLAGSAQDNAVKGNFTWKFQ